MMNYIEKDAALIREKLPEGAEIPDNADTLFHIYAVLMRAKGGETSASDVHDAWSAWMTGTNSEHKSVEPFAELESETQAEDGPFLLAIRRAAATRAGNT